MTDTVNIFTPGHLDIYDSYGLIAVQLTRHLTRLGVYVNAIPLGDRQMDSQPADIAEIVRRPIRPVFGGILLGYPTSYAAYGVLASAGPRVAVTMFESTQIPATWPPLLNELDAVIVPSKFCRDVFISCGVTAPVYVAPLGIGEIYQPAVRQRKPGDPFTFLAFVDRGVRKGWHHATQAFVKAFDDDPNYRLILKARTGDGPPIAITNPNITLLQQDMTEQELYELYLSADVLVNANMGEGFGLIPREFAATGGLSLATNWGGTAERIGEWGLPIAHDLVPAWGDKHHPKGLGMWADPDIPELASLMEVVAQTRDRWQPKAYERAGNLHKLYSWEKFGRSVLAHWKSAVMKPVEVMEYA